MFAHGASAVEATNRAAACEPVDVITGPGNVWVTAAKRIVMGTVGIDAEAGPTEIAILADEQANPAFVAADLISQAEHDPLAGSDRKSTRLNSSHVAISYAVFCLKKKKNEPRETPES